MIHHYKLPLKNGPYGSFREGLIVQTETGFGDIAPLLGISPETFEEAREEAVRLLPDFPNVEPKLPSVRFAFDCAKVPLKSVSVPVNALNEYRPGFSVVKIKVAKLSVEQTKALIDQIPTGIGIRLDFNRQWPLEKLFRLADLYPPTAFDYLEEPTRDFSELLQFSEKTGFPIAMDESIPDVPYWQIPTLKALVVKPTILGTVPKPPPGVELIFSSVFESGVGVTHIARLAAQHNPNRPHGLDPYTHLQSDLLVPRPTIENGLFKWSGPPCIAL
jgi:O-succinylbenzoate synthase